MTHGYFIILAFLLFSSNVIARIIDTETIPKHNFTAKYDIINQLQNITTKFANINFKEIKNVNNDCLEQLELYVTGMFEYDWALKMFDASGKLEPGILELNTYSLGSFDECLSIHNVQSVSQKSISGQYCLGTLTLPITALSLALCVPAACSATELNEIMVDNKVPYTFSEVMCQVYKEHVEFDAGDIVTIIFLSIIVAIAISSTAYEIYLSYNEKLIEGRDKTLVSFSLWTNGKKLFATSQNSDQLECISGIRAITMMWIIYGHSFGFINATPIANFAYLLKFYEDGWTMYLRGGTIAVDTFLLMGGIVLMYVYLKSTKKDQVWFNVFHYYLHRYIRLTPTMAITILVNATLLRHFGAGPMRPVIDGYLEGCQKNWWTNLLYINNFINLKEACLGQTWYLAVDMQLFLVSPLILMPIRRWKKATLGLIVAACSASLTCSFLMAWFLKLNDSGSLTLTAEESDTYQQYYYVATYNRASPWFIGVLMGYAIYHVKVTKETFRINRILNIFLWMCSLAVLLTCLFYDNSADEYDRTAMSFHVTFVRPAWAIAVGWVIFACVTGYGGPVNGFLSLPIFQILARLTFSMYLLHCSIIILVYVSAKSAMTVSTSLMMYNYWPLYMVSVGVAIVWTLLFESPIIMLEKSLKAPKKTK